MNELELTQKLCSCSIFPDLHYEVCIKSFIGLKVSVEDFSDTWLFRTHYN